MKRRRPPNQTTRKVRALGTRLAEAKRLVERLEGQQALQDLRAKLAAMRRKRGA